MLKLRLAELQFFDQKSQQFISFPSFEMILENSLSTLSKWESKHEKYFLGNENLTPEEYFDYLKSMIIDDGGYPDRFNYLSESEMQQITDYINAKGTATTFRSMNNGASQMRIVTSEVIYYWMTCFHIPFEADHWNLNRLVTLIRVCSEKNKAPKKVSNRELAASRTAENLRRRKMMKTKG